MSSDPTEESQPKRKRGRPPKQKSDSSRPVAPPKSAPHARGPEPFRRDDLSAIERHVEPPIDPDATYPMFPEFPPGFIKTMRVFRVHPKPGGVAGINLTPIAIPWDATTCTWETITALCGGGSYRVQALCEEGVIRRSIHRKFDGPEKKPTAADVIAVTASVSGAQVSASLETPNGWLVVPGLEPAAQVAFFTFQQMAWRNRQDALVAQQQLVTLMSQLVEQIGKPDQSINLLMDIVRKQESSIGELQKSVKETIEEKNKLELDMASKKTSSSKAFMYEQIADALKTFGPVMAEKLFKGTESTASPPPQHANVTQVQNQPSNHDQSQIQSSNQSQNTSAVAALTNAAINEAKAKIAEKFASALTKAVNSQ